MQPLNPSSYAYQGLDREVLNACYEAINFATEVLDAAFNLAGSAQRVQLISFWARVSDSGLISYIETLERCTGERPAGSLKFLAFDEGEARPVLPVVAALVAGARGLVDQDRDAPGRVGRAVAMAADWAFGAGVRDPLTVLVASGVPLQQARRLVVPAGLTS